MNFTIDVLVQARTSVERFQALYDRVRIAAAEPPAPANKELAALIKGATSRFDDGLDDNLNMSRALAELFAVSSAANQRELTSGDAIAVRNFLEYANDVFAVLDHVPHSGQLSSAELSELAASGGDASDVPHQLARRHAARQARDFKSADELRKQLASQGVELEDMRDGVRWRKR
jgi:cysteinyl-tRNA synthetase